MKDKIVGTIVGIVVVFLLGSMIYMTIKYPRPYPNYDNMSLPPYYSPYPGTNYGG